MLLENKKNASQKPSALIIDDDQFILRALGKLFSKQGYESETAESGNEALEKINKRCFDVVLIDARLPDMNGIDLLPSMNCDKTIKIILTGYPSDESKYRAIELGADAYLSKPLRAEELFTLIDEKSQKQL